MSAKVSVNVKSLIPAFCPECDKTAFYELLYEIRQLPAILSPVGKAGVFLTPVYRCSECKHVFYEEQLIKNKFPRP